MHLSCCFWMDTVFLSCKNGFRPTVEQRGSCLILAGRCFQWVPHIVHCVVDIPGMSIDTNHPVGPSLVIPMS